MKVQVSGQHMSIGESLAKYTEDRIKDVVGKYFERAVSANVHFLKHSYLHNCDIMVNEGTGRHMVIKSEASCNDVYSSFDQALAKLEKQLRKYKARIKDHHKTKTSEAYLEAVKYIINPYSEEVVDEHAPITIAEKPTKVGTYSVSEAIMKMDLADLPALMFKNAANKRMNIVYYKRDGNIAWVDSRE